MKMKVKDSISQSEYSGENCTNRISKAEDRTPDFTDKLLAPDQICKDDERMKAR